MQAQGEQLAGSALNELICRGTRDDPRDEEDVGTDLDFSKYTRDRVNYESGGNMRDLWAAIYRPRGTNQRELRSAAVKVAALPRCAHLSKKKRRALAQTPPRSMSAIN